VLVLFYFWKTFREIIQDSDIREFQVQKDDLIVLSSDGMFDVVQDSAIIKAVNSNTDKNLQTIADELLVLSMKCT
jgi:serine/threonine protein phosphatase PrpC